MSDPMPPDVAPKTLTNEVLLDDLISAAEWAEGSYTAKMDRAWLARLDALRREAIRRMKA